MSEALSSSSSSTLIRILLDGSLASPAFPTWGNPTRKRIRAHLKNDPIRRSPSTRVHPGDLCSVPSLALTKRPLNICRLHTPSIAADPTAKIVQLDIIQPFSLPAWPYDGPTISKLPAGWLIYIFAVTATAGLAGIGPGSTAGMLVVKARTAVRFSPPEYGAVVKTLSP
ncbi:hypothetical protein GALMADRAFT_146454 [Galerina marginata CBS 339.88]|uniref:Uncharacterized protein n=1 Tax=Galerina marginata (strain CBS 339.88) TaxID=685588 RepID=A0A067SBG4_GALM3|nr:hypothetical protein GALMADRAFT_146454 [Galerina marginata CBS 339.88]